MAPTDTVAELFLGRGPEDEKLGIAVTLVDRRSDEVRRQDAAMNIHHISGDILKKPTWTQIGKVLDGRRADLILERALAGLIYIPKDDKLLYLLLNRAWNLLADNGTMLIQVPFGYGVENPQSNKWVDYLNQNLIDARLGQRSLKLVKKSDSPANLPTI